MEFIKIASEEGFSFHPVNISDVILAISHFSQAKETDEVPQNVIVKALPVIGNYLVKIFNTSFAHGIFPSAWKRAQIIALNKNISLSSVSDFRPRALLCFLSKILDAAQMVSVWAENSGLCINAGKTKAIFFGSKKGVNFINSMDLPGIGTGTGVLIPFSSEVVSLGVTLDSKLT